MYIFLDLTERIDGIKKKIKEMERDGGISPSPNLPDPGTRKELGKAMSPSTATSSSEGKAAPTKFTASTTGNAGFGPDGLQSSLVPDRAEKEPKTEREIGPVDPLEISEVVQ